MPLTIIAAVARNNCIGKDNRLPWNIPDDMLHFKRLTLGKVVVMGRKTWESLPDRFRPLPDRTNVVITRQTAFAPPGALVCHSLEEVAAKFPSEELFVIGGAELYRQTIGLSDKMHITELAEDVEGDAYFPEIQKDIWREVSRESHGQFAFVTYQRK